MESLLIYGTVVAWALDSSGSRGLEAIPEQQRRLIWLKKKTKYLVAHVIRFFKEKKKKQKASDWQL